MVRKIFIFSLIYSIFFSACCFAQEATTTTPENQRTSATNPYDLTAPAGDLNTRANTAFGKAQTIWQQSLENIKNFFSRQISAVQDEYNAEKKTLFEDINDLIQNNKIIRTIRSLFEGKKAIEGGLGG